MGWCACSRKCTRCLGSRGGDADGWSASASILCIPLQPHSSKALPRFSGDVYTCVVGAKSWQLHRLACDFVHLPCHCAPVLMAEKLINSAVGANLLLPTLAASAQQTGYSFVKPLWWHDRLASIQ